uniref:hypothetical protein n=1 Tax=Gormaniella terricola TaxID=2904618 RepID=UPI0021CC969E|nr:hypothetical protein [Gormaniella terricola]UWV18224.1 hypothetical protein [Gormaniella terricola]
MNSLNNKFYIRTSSHLTKRMNGLSRGMLDSDGSIGIRWEKDRGSPRLRLEVNLGARIENRMMLEEFKNSWGVGNIHGKLLSVQSFQTLEKMTKVFKSGPLFSHQSLDFQMIDEIKTKLVDKKLHLTPNGKEQILDLKYRLHDNKPSSLATTREDYEKMLNLSRGSSVGKGNSIYDHLASDYKEFKLETINSMKNKNLVLSEEDYWYITGFTLGDGSFFISFGIPRIIPCFTLTTNLASSLAPEFCFYGLTNEYNPASKVGNDACRMTFSSISKVMKFVIPHFEQYPLIDCPKKDVYNTYKAACEILNKHKTQVPPFSVVEELVELAYDMNPIVSDRRFESKEQYLSAYKAFLSKSKN